MFALRHQKHLQPIQHCSEAGTTLSGRTFAAGQRCVVSAIAVQDVLSSWVWFVTSQDTKHDLPQTNTSAGAVVELRTKDIVLYPPSQYKPSCAILAVKRSDCLFANRRIHIRQCHLRYPSCDGMSVHGAVPNLVPKMPHTFPPFSKTRAANAFPRPRAPPVINATCGRSEVGASMQHGTHNNNSIRHPSPCFRAIRKTMSTVTTLIPSPRTVPDREAIAGWFK